MKTLKIGIIREGKTPVDTRVVLNPVQAEHVLLKYHHIDLVVQSSADRCFSDEEYWAKGIQVVDRVDDCDILFGVKEVPIDRLIDGKTYFFFSHTIKKQPYNKKLLQTILNRKIRLVDYECLTNESGLRVIAFGRWAGIVGTYNAFWVYGKKTGRYEIRRAKDCLDLNDLKKEFGKIDPGPIKFLITGNGRVSRGGLEILDEIGIKRTDPETFLHSQPNEPIYCQADVDMYNRHKMGESFDFQHFFNNPEEYTAAFHPFSLVTDILIMASYWDPRAPRLFNLADISKTDFKIKVIADITCDIDGAVPTTFRATTINDPVYDISRESLQEKPAFSHPDHISEMSIDNLPNELPRDASTSFGDQLIKEVLPSLLIEDTSSRIMNATIAEKGKLTPKFSYLSDYVAE